MFNNKFRIGVLQHPGYNKGKGGGGGSAGPTQSTNYTTNIPEYAKPYVENMLNATQAQIYTPDMTGFNKYVPYSTNPTNYIAGFSPLQQYAQSGAANLNLPANYGLATGQTLGTGMQMGALAPQMGMAGANYARQATSPYATQAYMNPYLSASLAPQLEEARRQYGITGMQGQGQATQAGAFGGTREALMAAENRRNMNQQMNQMIGQGYNNAFNQAQQAQQFGANLGLQGQQAQMGALQGQLGAANQLAGLGGQQLQAQQGIYNLQNQLGQQQQTQQQNIINQAIQNYATEQQYPFMQLGVLNSMLRGLPMQQSSTQMYQAPPSFASQAAGLGTGALGALGMYNAATGQKAGGLTSIKKMSAGGTAVPMKSFTDPQLGQVANNPRSDLMDKLYAQELMQDRSYIKANPLAGNIMSQPLPNTPMPAPTQMAMAPQNRVGLDNIGTGDMTQMAGGGLLAFVGGGDTSLADTKPAPKAKAPVDAAPVDPNDPFAGGDFVGAIKNWWKQPTESSNTLAQRQAIEKEIADRTKMSGSEALTRFGLKMMAGSSPYALTNIGEAGADALDYYAKQMGLNQADKKLLLQQAVEAEKAEDARKAQLLGYGIQAQTAKENKQIGLRGLELQAANLAQSKEDANKLAYTKLYGDLKEKYATQLYRANPNRAQELTDEQIDDLSNQMAIKALVSSPDAAKYLSLTPATPAAPKALPMPSTAKDAVVGQIYSTSRGQAKWDGKQFIPVQ
jgi:hypothetical protein